MADWRENLVESREGITSILAEKKRIAVLGIKTEAQRDRLRDEWREKSLAGYSAPSASPYAEPAGR